MEVSERISVSVTENEEFSKDALHVSGNTPVFTASTLNNNLCEISDTTTTTTTAPILSGSTCLVNAGPSITSSKTVPFYPRVLVNTQQPVPPTSIPILSDPERLPQQPTHLSNVVLPPFTCQTSTISTTQFFPLILTATPINSHSNSSLYTSNVQTPVQVQVNNTPCNTPITTNHSIHCPPPVPICGPSQNFCASTVKPCCANGSSASCSVITSTVSRNTVSIVNSLAPVVISPQIATSVSSAFTLRFAPPTTLHCNPFTTTPSNSFLFETPVLSNQLTPTSHPQQSMPASTPTAINVSGANITSSSLATVTTSTGTPPTVSLLMSSGLCPASRVLIHKSTGLTSGSGSGITDPYSLTLVTAPIRAHDSGGAVGQLNVCAVPSTASEQSAASFSSQGSVGQSPLHTPQKAKLVSLGTHIPANVRLFTNPSVTVPHTVKCTNMTGTYTASLTNTTSNATMHSVVSPGKSACAGLWTSLSGSNGVTQSSLVTLQNPPPILVQTTPELVTLPPTGTTPNSQVSSLRHVIPVTAGGTHSTAPLSLSLSAPSAPPPTVLAFSLSTTTPSPISVSGAGIQNPPGGGMRHGGTTNPLVVRTSGGSTVISTSTSNNMVTPIASLTSASLLKPFSLSLPGGMSTTPSYFYTSVHSSGVQPSSVAAVSQVVPVSIAPARPPTLATSLAVSSSPSTGTVRSQLHSAISSCILSPRHNLTSIFSHSSSSSASNRKRARKQQLASAFSTTTSTTPPTATMTTTAASGLTVIPCSSSIAISPTVSMAAKNNNTSTTLSAVPSCTAGTSIPLTQLSPISCRTSQAVTPTIVAIPKPIIQPTQSLNPAALPIQSLTTVSHRSCGSPSEPPQLKFPNTSLMSSVCVTTCTCPTTSLNTITTATSITSTPGGYVGIRLLSVRPSSTSLVPSCATSLATTGESTSTLPTGVSGLITRIGASGVSSEITSTTTTGSSNTGAPQLRLSACATTPEGAHTQAATVYVLTTSNAYPILPPGTSSALATSANDVESQSSVISQSAITTASNAPYATALMMPGSVSGPGLVQVRLRAPLTMTTSTTHNGNSALFGAMSTNTSTITPPLVLDTGYGSPRFTGPSVPNMTHVVTATSPNELTISRTRSPHSSDTAPPRLTPLRSCVSLSSNVNTSTNNNSLLHRHLLSPQNPVHSEHVPPDENARVGEPTSSLQTPLFANLVELFAAERAAVSGEPATPSESTTAFARNRDTDSHGYGRLKHLSCGYRATENHLRITAAADVATEEAINRLEDEEEYEELNCIDDAKPRVSDVLCLPRKRLKLDETVKPTDEKALDDEQLLLLLQSRALSGKAWSNSGTASGSGMQLSSSGGTVRLAINPADGCEWVLNGLPEKPSIIPKCMMTNSRSGAVWRAKATHFLSLSEIRSKPENKWDTPGSIRRDPSDKFYLNHGAFAKSNTRRHRRALSRRASLDRASDNGSVHSPSSKRLSNTVGSAGRRLLHDIIALRLQQSELQLVRFPLSHTSVLNISGWRVLSCANNLDLLVFSEHQSLQSMSSLHVSLRGLLTPTAFIGNKYFPESLSQLATYPNRPCDPYDPYGISSGLGSDSSESDSTATVLSSLSSLARAPMLARNEELVAQAERALDLILGICQRKRYLIDSLQRLHCRSQRIVEQFRDEALAFFDEMEQGREEREPNQSQTRSNNPSTPSPPLSTSSATKASWNATSCTNPTSTTTINTSGSGRSTPMHMRRSTRTCSPNPHSLKRFRSRDSAPDLGEESTLSNTKSSNLLNSNYTKTALLCNGEAGGNNHGSRR